FGDLFHAKNPRTSSKRVFTLAYIGWSALGNRSCMICLWYFTTSSIAPFNLALSLKYAATIFSMALVVFPIADTTKSVFSCPTSCKTLTTFLMLSASFTDAPPNLKTLIFFLKMFEFLFHPSGLRSSPVLPWHLYFHIGQWPVRSNPILPS